MPSFALSTPTALVDVVQSHEQVAARLQQLHPDLTVALFMEVATAGLAARNDTTRASAPTAAGGQQWFKSVERLRTLLAARQWRMHDERNCPYVTAPDSSVSIVVMTGNWPTGKNVDEQPTNQATKGSVAQDFTEKNRQLELFNQNAMALLKAKNTENGTGVWVLLYHYDNSANEVRLELSFPIDFDNFKITEWSIRIIVGSMPNKPTAFDIKEENQNTPAMVSVEIKTGTL